MATHMQRGQPASEVISSGNGSYAMPDEPVYLRETRVDDFDEHVDSEAYAHAIK